MNPIEARAGTSGTSPDGDQTETGTLTYTAQELLDVVLEAWQRGFTAGMSQAGRQRWLQPEQLDAFRSARTRTEIDDMNRRSVTRYESYGYPAGYTYRGGAVDWHTGMPQGSGCAWLRRKRSSGQAAA